MAELQKKKKLNQAEYETLCREACARPKRPASNESLEDAYWWSVCRDVYHYLDINFMFDPIEGASRGHVYRVNLQRLVRGRQTTRFSPIDIAGEYIHQALARKKQRSHNAKSKKQCEVHGEFMTPMMVPYLYGTPIMDDDFQALIDARARLFPNAHSHFLGGCHLGSKGGQVEYLVCLKCRQAEKKWSEETGLSTEPAIGGFIF